jgi:hypothetical protein
VNLDKRVCSILDVLMGEKIGSVDLDFFRGPAMALPVGDDVQTNTCRTTRKCIRDNPKE